MEERGLQHDSERAAEGLPEDLQHVRHRMIDIHALR
mgnify:CR=1 FL=1